MPYSALPSSSMASSSSSSSAKRKRTAQPTPPPAAIVEEFSSFFNDPDADVILRAVDGRLFATKRAYLVAASSVFEDMFRLPQANGNAMGVVKDGQAAPGSLPAIDMPEAGQQLEVFLRWVHRDTFDAIYDEFSAKSSLTDLKDAFVPLLFCAEKYNAKAVFRPVFKIVGEYASTTSPNVLALSVIFKRRDVARDAMEGWAKLTDLEGGPRKLEGYATYNVRRKKHFDDRRPWAVADIWDALFPSLPPGFFLHLSYLEQDLLYAKRYDQAAAIAEFMTAFDAGFPLDKCTYSYPSLRVAPFQTASPQS